MTYKEYKDFLNYEIYDQKKYGLFKKIKILSYPSRKSVWLIRTTQFYYHNPFLGFISVYYQRKLVTKYGIFYSPNCNIKKGLKLPHPNGIIIGEAVEIGNNCTIYQQVTIGSRNKGDYLNKLQPKIGDNVVLFSGCKIIGDIEVRDGSEIGANSVLTKSTEYKSIYAGIPAKKIK